MKKQCSCCKLQKQLNNFSKNKNRKDGLNPYCKQCVAHKRLNNPNILEAEKQYSKNNRDKRKSYANQYRKRTSYDEKYYLDNKKECLEYGKQYRKNNREVINAKQKKRYNLNKKTINLYSKDYYKKHTNELRKYNKNYNKAHLQEKAIYRKNRIANDTNFKVASNIRSRISNACKDNYKTGSSVRDLGCSISEFKIYIEQKFQPGMSWENYGLYVWHLDHIIPLSSFDLSNREQFLKACHYTNYQPLWAKDNLSKNNK